MEVGVKYCGGCNPRYNRKALLQRLITHFKDKIAFQNISGEKTYDIILVLSACKTNCTDFQSLKSRKGFVCVTGEEDYEEVVGELAKLVE